MSHHQRTRAVAITIAAQYLTDIGRGSSDAPRAIDDALGVYDCGDYVSVAFGDGPERWVNVEPTGKVTES